MNRRDLFKALAGAAALLALPKLPIPKKAYAPPKLTEYKPAFYAEPIRLYYTETCSFVMLEAKRKQALRRMQDKVERDGGLWDQGTVDTTAWIDMQSGGQKGAVRFVRWQGPTWSRA